MEQLEDPNRVPPDGFWGYDGNFHRPVFDGHPYRQWVEYLWQGFEDDGITRAHIHGMVGR